MTDKPFEFKPVAQGFKLGELNLTIVSGQSTGKTMMPLSMIKGRITPEKMKAAIDTWYGPGTYDRMQITKEIEG